MREGATRPRRFSRRRKAKSEGLGLRRAMSMTRTSRRPPVLTATAMVTAPRRCAQPYLP
jgi:hypothetical protein